MIKPLTSLRFVFAFMVFASHMDFLVNSESELLNWIYENVFHEGYIGVSFFFILSGFILAFNYQDRIVSGEISKYKFYLARFARIYPLHLLTFVLSVPLTVKLFLTNKALWASQAITTLTLTQSFIPVKKIYFSFNAPSWSISDEMFFYITFPFLILLGHKVFKNNRILLIGIIALIPLLAIFIPSDYSHQLFYINPIFRVFDFIIGIILYNIYRKNAGKIKPANYNALEISSLFVLVAFFVMHSWIPQVARYSFYYWIPMSYLIYSFSFQKGFVSKILSKKSLIYLGEISFGFYMFHQLVLRYFHAINSRVLNIENDYLIIGLVLSLSLIISHYSYRRYETPMNKFIKKRL